MAGALSLLQAPTQASPDVTAQKIRKNGAYVANAGTGSPVCLSVSRSGKLRYALRDYRGPSRRPYMESETIRRRPPDQYPFKWVSRYGSTSFDFRGSSVLISPYYGEGGPQSWLLMKRVNNIRWAKEGCRD